MYKYLVVAAGGSLGAMLRYFLGVVAARHFGPRFPVGTLTINVTACFLIGLVLSYLDRHAGLSPLWRLAIATGFIGAYSTFSTYEWEIWRDITSGAFWTAMLYLVVSLVAGLVAVSLGSATARTLP